MLVTVTFLTIYLIGSFYFCRFVSTFEWAAAGALCLLSFSFPVVGFCTVVAGIPLIIDTTNNAPAYFSGVELFFASALLGATCRLWLHYRFGLKERHWLISVVGIIVFFSITPFFRFASLLSWWLPDMVKITWLHLYNGDQVSPFAFVYRGWIWILGVLFFFAIKRHGMSPQGNLLPRPGTTLKPDQRLKLISGMASDKWNFDYKLDWTYWGLLASGLLMACVSIHDIIIKRRTPINYSLVFDERNTYAAFWVLEVGLLASLWKGRSRILEGVAFLSFILFSLFVFASGSLGGLLGWLVVVALAVIIFSRKKLVEILTLSFYKRNWLKLLTAFLLLYFLLPTLALVYPPSDPVAVAENLGQRIRSVMPGRASQNLRQQRAFFWAAGWEMFKESPVFGVGIGRYYQMSSVYLSRLEIRQLAGGIPYPHENAHNYFLQIAAETGIVGFALFAGFLFWLLVRRWDFRGSSKNSGAGIAIIGLLVMSLTGHPLLVQSIFFMCCAIAALVTVSPSQNGCRVSRVGCQGSDGDVEEEVAGRRLGARRAIKLPRGVWISLAGILLVLYIFHVKSIWNVLPQNFEWGFYATEGEGKQAYRWTRGLALALMDRDQLRPFSVRAANPDLAQRAVKVLICADDHILKELELKDYKWYSVEIPAQRVPPRFVLGIKTSRTWTPAKYGPPDYRELGVMVRF